MKSWVPGILFILLLLTSHECIYMESGAYFVDPVPSDPPSYSVETSLDTLSDRTVTDSLKVTYQIEIENGKFYATDAFLAQHQIFFSDSSHGTFIVYPYQAGGPGTDTIYLNFYISSNTNSIADLFELEANLVQLKYGLFFEEAN